MRTVRAFGKELTEVQKYSEKTDYIFELAKKEAMLSAGFYGVVRFILLVVYMFKLYCMIIRTDYLKVVFNH